MNSDCVVDFIFLVFTETYFPFIITEVDVLLQIAILYDLIHGLKWQKACRNLSWYDMKLIPFFFWVLFADITLSKSWTRKVMFIVSGLCY